MKASCRRREIEARLEELRAEAKALYAEYQALAERAAREGLRVGTTVYLYSNSLSVPYGTKGRIHSLGTRYAYVEFGTGKNSRCYRLPFAYIKRVAPRKDTVSLNRAMSTVFAEIMRNG